MTEHFTKQDGSLDNKNIDFRGKEFSSEAEKNFLNTFKKCHYELMDKVREMESLLLDSCNYSDSVLTEIEDILDKKALRKLLCMEKMKERLD